MGLSPRRRYLAAASGLQPRRSLISSHSPAPAPVPGGAASQAGGCESEGAALHALGRGGEDAGSLAADARLRRVTARLVGRIRRVCDGVGSGVGCRGVHDTSLTSRGHLPQVVGTRRLEGTSRELSAGEQPRRMLAAPSPPWSAESLLHREQARSWTGCSSRWRWRCLRGRRSSPRLRQSSRRTHPSSTRARPRIETRERCRSVLAAPRVPPTLSPPLPVVHSLLIQTKAPLGSLS